MYCGACQEERLGTAKFCAACGARLSAREREEIEQELAHVQFLLAQLEKWDPERVPQPARVYLKGRYLRTERVLLTALLGATEVSSAESAEGVTRFLPLKVSDTFYGPPRPDAPEAGAVATGAPSDSEQRNPADPQQPRSNVVPLPARANAERTEPSTSEPAASNASSSSEPTGSAPGAGPAAADPTQPESRRPPKEDEAQGAEEAGPAAAAKSTPEDEESAPSPEAAFEVPTPARAQRERAVVSATSRWGEVWKPFLTESIGWFLGAFLILAGTFYWVAESWAGMTSLMRSLVVFGAAAVYSSGFSFWGRLLSRREKLLSAGRVLELIGACAAPLSALALQGLPVWLCIPVALGWSLATFTLWRRPAVAFANKVEGQALPLLAAGTTLLLGASPFAAAAGGPALWLIVGPLALGWRTLRAAARTRQTGDALAFTLLASSGLLALAAVRLHVALAVAGHPPAFGSWAPFLAALGACILERRQIAPASDDQTAAKAAVAGGSGRAGEAGAVPTAKEPAAADALSVAIIALQLGCVALSSGGVAPSFFVTAAVATWTALRLSVGTWRRASWLYVAYGAGYLAYQSVGQLVPGPLKQLLTQVEGALGYGAGGASLPFAYDSIYAAPFLIFGAVLALRAERRSLTEVFAEERHRAVANVLYRSTAIASALFSALALHPSDPRPALVVVPVASALCLGLGVWRKRQELSRVGSLLAVLLVWPLGVWGGPKAVALGAGLLALALAASRARWASAGSDGRTAATLVLAGVGGLTGWLMGAPGPVGLAAIALSAAALFVLSRVSEDERLELLSELLAASLVPQALLWLAPGYAMLGLSLLAVGLAVLGWNGHAPSRPTALLAAICAGVVQALLAINHGWEHQPVALGVVLLLCAAATAIVSFDLPVAGWATLVLVNAAALPQTWDLASFAWLHQEGSAIAYALLALAASALSRRKARSAGLEGPATPDSASPWRWQIRLSALLSIILAGYTILVAADQRASTLTCAVLAALASILATRALTPWLTLPWASALLVGVGIFDQAQAFPIGALVFTAIALVELRPSLREKLFGAQQVALVASLCGALLLWGACDRMPWPQAVTLALAIALPLLWTRATQAPLFAALPLLLIATATNWTHLAIGERTRTLALPGLGPIYAVVLTRALLHFKQARALLLGDKPERAAWASTATMATLFGTALLLTLDAGTSAVTVASVAALVVGAAEPTAVRLALAGVLAYFVPQLHAVLWVVLTLGAFAVHHFPKLGGWLIGSEDRPAPSSAGSSLRQELAVLALAVSVLPLTHQVGPWQLAMPTASLFLTGLLLPQPWLWTTLAGGIAATLASRQGLAQPAVLPLMIGSAAVAALAVPLRWEAVRERVRGLLGRLAPRPEGDLAQPLWIGAAVVAAVAVGGQLSHPLHLPLAARALACAAPLLLLLSPVAWEAAVGTILVELGLLAFVPEPWGPVAVSGFGAALTWLAPFIPTGAAKPRNGGSEPAPQSPHSQPAKTPSVPVLLHHLGWAFALGAMLLLRGLNHPATAETVALASVAVWGAVRGKAKLEWLGWLSTWLTLHVSLLSWAVAHPTGKQVGFIFPYLAATSVLLAIVALLLPRTKERKPIGLVLSAIGIAEVVPAVVLLSEVAPREAWVATVSLVLLAVLLVRRAVAEQEEAAALLAQGALVVGYAVVRCLGFGAHHLGARDALAAIVSGALFMGLSAWAAKQPAPPFTPTGGTQSRNGGAAAVFERPARIGAFVLPLIALVLIPWSEPMSAAALLLATSVHFGTLSLAKRARGPAAVLTAASFNAAILVAWLGQGANALELYVLPAGISILILLWVFRKELQATTQARLRAVVVTAMYAVTAFRALTFEHSSSLFLCVFVCLLGVGMGIALRIRSYVYLGSAFLVTAVVANLVRFGVRDHRAGALFLSVLGLLVVGFMILITAQREELLARYGKLRAMLETWEA